jgi:hypothetical protein
MNDEQINLEKIKQIFSYSTGERTIEVTEEEYRDLLTEAKSKGLSVQESNDSFTIRLGELEVKIVCDFDDEEELDEEDI